MFASSLTEITDDDQVTDTDLTTIGPANGSTLGGVLGLGFRAADDVGVKVDVEFLVAVTLLFPHRIR